MNALLRVSVPPLYDDGGQALSTPSITWHITLSASEAAREASRRSPGLGSASVFCWLHVLFSSDLLSKVNAPCRRVFLIPGLVCTAAGDGVVSVSYQAKTGFGAPVLGDRPASGC